MNENLHQRIKKIIAPLNSLERAVYFFSEAVRLHVLYGLILSTPAKEIKKMKLRQIKKELKMLNAKFKEESKRKITVSEEFVGNKEEGEDGKDWMEPSAIMEPRSKKKKRRESEDSKD